MRSIVTLQVGGAGVSIGDTVCTNYIISLSFSIIFLRLLVLANGCAGTWSEPSKWKH